MVTFLKIGAEERIQNNLILKKLLTFPKFVSANQRTHRCLHAMCQKKQNHIRAEWWYILLQIFLIVADT
ncbi:MAG: hypothetical protein EBY35_12590 [Rhodobacteraceae bacterium]|nr:hypothetical protein [Paracoccaceae bacterium]